MRRRDLLAAVASGTTVGVAGCLASGRDVGGIGGADDGTGSEGCEYQGVGEAEVETDPHYVILENDGDSDREVVVEIATDGEAVVNESRELPADDRLEFRLVDTAEYSVSVVTDGASTELRLSGAPGDCRESVTRIVLHDGGISTRTEAAAGDCERRESDPDDGFEHGDGECARGSDRDHATIDVEDDVIRVEGAVETPTPCHRLAMAEFDEEPDDDILEIVVTVDDPETDLCVQCIGIVPYTAVIDRPDPPPDSVAVVHETFGERRTVGKLEC